MSGQGVPRGCGLKTIFLVAMVGASGFWLAGLAVLAR